MFMEKTYNPASSPYELASMGVTECERAANSPCELAS